MSGMKGVAAATAAAPTPIIANLSRHIIEEMRPM